MKELKLYQCEICGTQYKEKMACTKCEKSHLQPCKIVHCRYVPYGNNIKGYPVAIEVSFKDGKTATYKR